MFFSQGPTLIHNVSIALNTACHGQLQMFFNAEQCPSQLNGAYMTQKSRTVSLGGLTLAKLAGIVSWELGILRDAKTVTISKTPILTSSRELPPRSHGLFREALEMTTRVPCGSRHCRHSYYTVVIAHLRIQGVRLRSQPAPFAI